ncbi:MULTISPECIES: hypothetical protein [unclassified Streptomyces]|uniref:hypothetical protein n=1 Tax=unclassified Streptomyces TaxID=2593676 RepID=UPI00343B1DE8
MLLTSAAFLAAVAGYAALCAVSPFGPCRKCSGTGLRELRKGSKLCCRCHGQRRRLRIGRRALNSSRRTHAAGTTRRTTTPKGAAPWH